jgi:hypothetical protein
VIISRLGSGAAEGYEREACRQDDVTAAVAAALAGDTGLLALTDESGRRVVVPSDKLAYVEIGEPESRRVGFGAL